MRRVTYQRGSAMVSVVFVTLVVISVLTIPVIAQTPPEPNTDNTVTRIHVYPNGTAQWTLQIRTELDTEQRVDEYETFQSRFRNDTGRYLDPFRTRMRGVVAAAANNTGRQMNATEFNASTYVQEVPRRWGIVTISFRWTDFAASANGTLVVGDVFQGGFFLAENDTMILEAPAGYRTVESSPQPDSNESGVLRWSGPQSFDDDRPTATFRPVRTTTATPATTRPESTTVATTTRQPSTGSDPSLFAGGAVIVLLAVVAFLVRRDTAETPRSAKSSEEDGGDGTPTDDPPVLTAEERVMNLLRANDGRMRQTDIADQFDWSASKASRVLGRLADDGRVEKLRIGRENVIDLRETDE